MSGNRLDEDLLCSEGIKKVTFRLKLGQARAWNTGMLNPLHEGRARLLQDIRSLNSEDLGWANIVAPKLRPVFDIGLEPDAADGVEDGVQMSLSLLLGQFSDYNITSPETIRLTDDTHDVRISGFQNACDATLAAAHVLRTTDKPEYRAPDQVYSFASDIFSVGVTLFEMATGAIPIPGHDARTIKDSAKRELVSFALRDEPSERPTAGALLEKTLELARSSAMAREVAAPASNAVRVGDGLAYTEEKE